MLKISIFDGEVAAPYTLVHLCDIEGISDDCPQSVLAAALKALESSSPHHAVPHFRGRCFTVTVGHKGALRTTPLVRLDGFAHNGQASAHVISDEPSWCTESVYYAPEDDAVTIVRKILAGQFPQ